MLITRLTEFRGFLGIFFDDRLQALHHLRGLNSFLDKLWDDRLQGLHSLHGLESSLKHFIGLSIIGFT